MAAVGLDRTRKGARCRACGGWDTDPAQRGMGVTKGLKGHRMQTAEKPTITHTYGERPCSKSLHSARMSEHAYRERRLGCRICVRQGVHGRSPGALVHDTLHNQ
jgi:hypothetical protein